MLMTMMTMILVGRSTCEVARLQKPARWRWMQTGRRNIQTIASGERWPIVDFWFWIPWLGDGTGTGGRLARLEYNIFPFRCIFCRRWVNKLSSLSCLSDDGWKCSIGRLGSALCLRWSWFCDGIFVWTTPSFRSNRAAWNTSLAQKDMHAAFSNMFVLIIVTYPSMDGLFWNVHKVTSGVVMINYWNASGRLFLVKWNIVERDIVVSVRHDVLLIELTCWEKYENRFQNLLKIWEASLEGFSFGSLLALLPETR